MLGTGLARPYPPEHVSLFDEIVAAGGVVLSEQPSTMGPRPELFPRRNRIVSGLALGMDGIAHSKALEVGLPTIAFPGSGLSNKALYPAAHGALAEKIISSGGALLSELEPEVGGAMWTFAVMPN